MANKCYNELYFTGDGAKVKEANLFLAGLPADDWDGAAIPGTEGYFQDLYFGQGCFHFGTRWVPDMVTVQAIADHFRVGFVLDYSDSMTDLYGQARYVHGKVSDIRLGVEDFAKIRYLPREDAYEYQGKQHRMLETLAKDLLKEKISSAYPVKQQRLKQHPAK
jgi:hypothetical protein